MSRRRYLVAAISLGIFLLTLLITSSNQGEFCLAKTRCFPATEAIPESGDHLWESLSKQFVGSVSF